MLHSFTYKTADDIEIFALKNNPDDSKFGLLCLPMMPATKESYIPLLNGMEKRNWLGYAIDFRGHGESTQHQTLDYHAFTDIDHQKYRIDAYEALMRLSEECEVEAVIGASIGANIALELQADFEVSKSVLLSPGLDYHGIETVPVARQVSHNQAAYVISSEEVRKSGPLGEEAEQIFAALATERKQIDIYPGVAHGTDIIVDQPTRLAKIIHFLMA